MSVPIDLIAIPTYAGDFHLARICVASVRHWEGDIPITLVKDISNGDFDTTDAEKYWNVKSVSVSGYGNPVAKLEALFLPARRILIIDADTVFIGRLATHLSTIDADVVINAYPQMDPRAPIMDEIYYNYDNVMAYDPSFQYPGYVFNSGLVAIRTNLISRKDLSLYFTYKTGAAHIIREDVFLHNDQGVLNYLLPKLAQERRLTLKSEGASLNAHPSVSDKLDFNTILNTGGIPKLIHWPGPKPADLGKFFRSDILRFYQNQYYARLPKPTEALQRHTRQTRVFKRRLKRMRQVYGLLPLGIRPGIRRAYNLLRSLGR